MNLNDFSKWLQYNRVKNVRGSEYFPYPLYRGHSMEMSSFSVPSLNRNITLEKHLQFLQNCLYSFLHHPNLSKTENVVLYLYY